MPFEPMFRQTNERFDQVESQTSQRFGQMRDEVNQRLDQIREESNQRYKALDERIRGLEQGQAHISGELSALKDLFTHLPRRE